MSKIDKLAEARIRLREARVRIHRVVCDELQSDRCRGLALDRIDSILSKVFVCLEEEAEVVEPVKLEVSDTTDPMICDDLCSGMRQKTWVTTGGRFCAACYQEITGYYPEGYLKGKRTFRVWLPQKRTWSGILMSGIKKGDIYQSFEPDGTPVHGEGDLRTTDTFLALEDAHKVAGVWTCESGCPDLEGIE